MKHSLSAALFLLGSVAAAQAAPASTDRAMAGVVPTERVQAASVEVTDESEGLNCGKSRKRLWVEGEGWVVRKVTICH